MTPSNMGRGDQGIEFSKNRPEISYPSSGNATCLEIEEHSFWFQHRNNCILQCLKRFPPAGAMFDVGGGNGYVALAMQKSGYETVLVEPGVEGARNARQRGLNNVICSTLENARFVARSLPAIGLFDVLEHISDSGRFLNELRQSLIGGGRLYLTVPAYEFLWSVDDDFAGHARRYTQSSLIRELVVAGFDVEYASYFFTLLPFPIFLTRTIPSRLGVRSSANSNGGVREHLSSTNVGRWLGAVFDWELRSIAAGRSLPFGSSCLMVARSRSAGGASVCR